MLNCIFKKGEGQFCKILSLVWEIGQNARLFF